MDSPLSLVPQTFGGYLGWFTSAVLGFLMIRVHMRKAQVDESAIILAKWQAMTEAHERRIEGLTSEVDGLRTRLVTAENTITEMQEASIERQKKHARELADKDEQIAGLRASIIQNSRSTAQMLGSPIPGDMTEQLGKLGGNNDTD